MSWTRTAVSYLVFVGGPIVGLVAVLRAGEGLEAPPAIGGAWVVEGCLGPDPVTISQSGRFLSVTADGAARTGRIEGDHVALTVVGATGPCEGVDVALDGALDGETLRGTASSHCDACDGTAFVARRAP